MMNTDGAQAMRQLPRYQCHKKVWALKIANITLMQSPELDPMASININAGGATITPVDAGYAPFHVAAEYLRKHQPAAGGYYVVYEDGYKSYSPASAFESGYTLIE